MIPHDYITEWRKQAPWIRDFQVEQDLVIARALVEVFSHPVLAERLAFRGGTALYKLHLQPPARYSEDIDLVQLVPGPVGSMMDAFHEVLDPWLGKPRWKQTEGRVTFVYRFESEDTPPLRMRLKVEINSREHFSVFDLERIAFSVASPWFNGSADIVTYELDELLATKLRAFYQRRKGRDLFDLAVGLDNAASDPRRIVEAFNKYMGREGSRVTRAQFERNLSGKLQDPQFGVDVGPMLAHGYQWDMAKAAQEVSGQLVPLLPGAPWKGME